MYEEAKRHRDEMKAKAHRLAGTRGEKVDASTHDAPKTVDAAEKTGKKPVSRRAFRSGGKVHGEAALQHAGKKPRAGGKAHDLPAAGAGCKPAGVNPPHPRARAGRPRRDAGGEVPTSRLHFAPAESEMAQAAGLKRGGGARVGKTVRPGAQTGKAVTGKAPTGKAQTGKTKGGRAERADGGRTKGNVNVIISTRPHEALPQGALTHRGGPMLPPNAPMLPPGLQGGALPPPGLPGGGTPVLPPNAPMLPPGLQGGAPMLPPGLEGGAPMLPPNLKGGAPMPQGPGPQAPPQLMPYPAPMGGAGAAQMMPMGQMMPMEQAPLKRGGRVHERNGAGSGLGRLEKADRQA